jgi:hypothetical protein
MWRRKINFDKYLESTERVFVKEERRVNIIRKGRRFVGKSLEGRNGLNIEARTR